MDIVKYHSYLSMIMVNILLLQEIINKNRHEENKNEIVVIVVG